VQSDVGHSLKDQKSNRRSHLPGYAAWEIHPVMTENSRNNKQKILTAAFLILLTASLLCFPWISYHANVVDMAGCSDYNSDYLWQISPAGHGGVSKIPHFFHPA
jgi:hypothetical protein